MSLIPQTFIDDVLSRTDIVEVIDSRVPLKKKGSNYMACCPFHNEKSPSFSVSQPKQFYHCFGCGVSGSAISFLMEYERLEFRDAVQTLANNLGLDLPEDTDGRAPQASRQPLYDVLTKADTWYQQQLRQEPNAIRYLQNRGLTGKTAKQFNIGWAPDAWQGVTDVVATNHKAAEEAGLLSRGQKDPNRFYDRFRGRVMFPIRDARGRAIGFGGRIIGDGEPKYLNSPETPVFHKGRELYGLYEARKAHRDLDKVLIVEGYMDVVMLAQHGVTNAVATLGTATTAEHIEKLYRITPEVVFCFDGDKAGRKAAWRALEHALPALRDGRQASFLFLPDGEDPDSMVQKEGESAFHARISDAQVASEFLFERLSAQCNVATVDGRAKLIESAKPYINLLPEGAFRLLAIQRLAELAHTDAGYLLSVLNSGGNSATNSTSNKVQGNNSDDGMASRNAPEPGFDRSVFSGSSRGSSTTVSGRSSKASSHTSSHASSKAPSQTPIRRAITLLVQYPQFSQVSIDNHAFYQKAVELDFPGAQLFFDLLEVAPSIQNTAMLLERFREHDYYRILYKLLSSGDGRQHDDEDAAKAEWKAVIQQLNSAINKVHITFLSSKAQLTESEKATLRHLMQEKLRQEQLGQEKQE